MAAAAIGLTALGTVVSAVGAIRQGQAASAAADYNAAIATQNEQITESQSIAAGEAQQRDAQRKLGSMVAAYGASGVQGSDGSPADVLADSVRSMTLDALTLKYNYKLKGLGFHNQAQLDMANSNNSRTASYFNAAGTMFSGAGRVASMASGSGGTPIFGG